MLPPGDCRLQPNTMKTLIIKDIPEPGCLYCPQVQAGVVTPPPSAKGSPRSKLDMADHRCERTGQPAHGPALGPLSRAASWSGCVSTLEPRTVIRTRSRPRRSLHRC